MACLPSLHRPCPRRVNQPLSSSLSRSTSVCLSICLCLSLSVSVSLSTCLCVRVCPHLPPLNSNNMTGWGFPETLPLHGTQAYRLFDKTDSGGVTVTDLKQLAADVGETFSMNEIEDMLNTADLNGDSASNPPAPSTPRVLQCLRLDGAECTVACVRSHGGRQACARECLSIYSFGMLQHCTRLTLRLTHAPHAKTIPLWPPPTGMTCYP